MFRFLKALTRASKGPRGYRGPRKARLSVEALEQRAVPAASMSISGTILTVTGNPGADVIRIRDWGNASDPIDIDLGDGRGFRYVPQNITRINVNTGRGDDFVQYELMDNLQTSVAREVWVNLSSGDDDFYAYLDDGFTSSDLMWGSHLKLIAQGGDGRDILGVTANMDVDVRAGASLLIDLAGDNDADNVFVDYRGELDGTLFLFAGGQAGNDLVRADLVFDSGSAGSLRGTSDKGVGSIGWAARVRGGDDDDTLYFNIYNNGGVDTFASIEGAGGSDVGSWTSNVAASSITAEIGKIVIA